MSRLFRKTLLLMIVLFGVIATGTSVVSGWNLYHQLTQEYRSKGAAIAKSIADSSVEILLDRDPATVQAVVDQFAEIDGVAYMFVADRSGDIVSHTFVPSIPPEVLALHSQAPAGAGKDRLVSVDFYAQGLGAVTDIAAPILTGVGGYAHVGMDRNLIRTKIFRAVIAQQGLMLLIFLLSVAIAYVLVNRISRPLNLLAEHARSLTAADFAAGWSIPAKVEALSSSAKDEIGNLAGSFVHMERTLQRSIQDLKETTMAKERIESELKIAHDIQMSMVPKIFPPFPHRREFDLYATLVPAKEVGGDFYDFFFIDEDHLCLAIGDVSGKGVPASLFMALTKTMFRATGGRQNATADTILSQLNGEICRDNDSCMFVTVFCGVLDVRTGQVEYSNAGHNLPYAIRNETVTALPNTGGMALGVSESVHFDAGQILLKPGDRLVLYTDGVTEAMDKEDQLFSESRLETTLRGVNGLNSKAVIEKVVKELQDFSTGAPQADDITLLVLGYMGPNGRGQHTSLVLLKNDLSELQRLNQIVTEFAEDHGLASELVVRLIVVLEEIITNVISHGYEDELEHEISVRLSWKDPNVKIEVEDDGRPFNPLEVPPPDMGKPLAEMQVGGLGIHLVREMMDELEYRREGDRNLLILKTKTRET